MNIHISYEGLHLFSVKPDSTRANTIYSMMTSKFPFWEGYRVMLSDGTRVLRDE